MQQIKSKQVKITLKGELWEAYEFLRLHKVDAAHYLFEGGKNAVINKAKDFGYKLKMEKTYGKFYANFF